MYVLIKFQVWQKLILKQFCRLTKVIFVKTKHSNTVLSSLHNLIILHFETPKMKTQLLFFQIDCYG